MRFRLRHILTQSFLPHNTIQTDSLTNSQTLQQPISTSNTLSTNNTTPLTPHSASGTVYEARHKETDAAVAVKKMDLAKQQRKELLISEIEVMKGFKHPNIVNYIESFLVGAFCGGLVCIRFSCVRGCCVQRGGGVYLW